MLSRAGYIKTLEDLSRFRALSDEESVELERLFKAERRASSKGITRNDAGDRFCTKGHLISGHNAMWSQDKSRCRTCHNNKCRAYMAARANPNPAPPQVLAWVTRRAKLEAAQ